jgi:hypothetical protein
VPQLLPDDNNPRYLQLYFYDGQYEAEYRQGCLTELRRDVIEILMKVTSQNPYARFFRSLREIEVTEETRILLNKNTVLDQRRANAPTSDEVAVIWPEKLSSSESSDPHIIVSGKSNQKHRIRHYYGCYDPLQYPLLFPRGESGWNQNIPKAVRVVEPERRTSSTLTNLSSDNVTEELLLNEAASMCIYFYPSLILCFLEQIMLGGLQIK